MCVSFGGNNMIDIKGIRDMIAKETILHKRIYDSDINNYNSVLSFCLC